MSPILREQKKPNPNYTFFKNYDNHIEFVKEKYARKMDTMIDRNTGIVIDHNSSLFLHDEILKHLITFDSLRDMHDYMDEIMGITLLPIAGASLAVIGLLLAGRHAINGLECKYGATGVTQDAKADNEFKYSMNFLMWALGAFGYAAVTFATSAVRLVTRPLVTATYGWKPQDENRFLDDGSAQAQVMNLLSR